MNESIHTSERYTPYQIVVQIQLKTFHLTSTAPVTQWTIEGLHRDCPSDSSCTWTFRINTHVGSVINVSFEVNGPYANGGSITFGDFTVTSGWSEQYGEDKGFTTLSTVDNKNNPIAFTSYPDAEVSNGAVVAGRDYPVYYNPGS